MNCLPDNKPDLRCRLILKVLLLDCRGVIILFLFPLLTHSEGTLQLEPAGSPSNSSSKIALTYNASDNRIPFAMLDCAADFRLNIRVRDYTREKIYLGFGDFIDYFNAGTVYTDVSFRVKDPAGNPVPGFALQPVPHTTGSAGYIPTRDEAWAGPDISNSNPSGYSPLVLTPTMNGDYVLEFGLVQIDQLRILKHFDVTVADGTTPRPGRLWSKAWQLSSSNISSSVNATHSKFYIYSSDSIVTLFDCNGLAGGVWTIYSNEWGCSTSGTWNERRMSIRDNATVVPEYMIFLSDPDRMEFPSGTIGRMNSFIQLPGDCDTVITFASDVSKDGNLEILLDLPPLNPGSVQLEDVQLGYNVTKGYNVLLPPWNGRNGYGQPLSNGINLEARIRFLNGLSNLPLFDVEDNPKGFKVDIHRPEPPSGNSKLRLYWDDSNLPPEDNPTVNVITGCAYSGIDPVSGCHNWSNKTGIGDINTVNSWWYYTSGETMNLPITLKMAPSTGEISGPWNLCSGQLATFRTRKIPYAQQYHWTITGPGGISLDYTKNAPDTTVTQLFASMPSGLYSITVTGSNPECGEGATVSYFTDLYDNLPPPVIAAAPACRNSQCQYQLYGTYTNMNWTVCKGQIIGSASANPVTILWNTEGPDTVRVMATSADCGTRLSTLPVVINPSASAAFVMPGATTACPGMEFEFRDRSEVANGSIGSRFWEWADGTSGTESDTVVKHRYSNPGTYQVKLTITTDKGCTSELTGPVRVIPYPVATFTTYRNCLSDSVQFLDQTQGADIISWDWFFGNTQVTTGNTHVQKPEVIYHATGTYPVQLAVSNLYGCRDTVIGEVTIHNLPDADFTHDNPCQADAIRFADASIPADTLTAVYTWTADPAGAGGTKVYIGNPAGIIFEQACDYTISYRVTDMFGCSDTTSEVIHVKPKPVSAFEIENRPGREGGGLQMVNSSLGASSYAWDFGNQVTSTLPEPDIHYTAEGEYLITLVVTSADGCTDTAVHDYLYKPGFWMPKAFTPNYDGRNDVFRPVTQRTSLDPYLMLIYDKWGQVIFRTADPGEGWDGTYKGTPCPTGTYIFTVQFRMSETSASTETVIQRGTLTLIR